MHCGFVYLFSLLCSRSAVMWMEHCTVYWHDPASGRLLRELWVYFLHRIFIRCLLREWRRCFSQPWGAVLLTYRVRLSTYYLNCALRTVETRGQTRGMRTPVRGRRMKRYMYIHSYNIMYLIWINYCYFPFVSLRIASCLHCCIQYKLICVVILFSREGGPWYHRGWWGGGGATRRWADRRAIAESTLFSSSHVSSLHQTHTLHKVS